MNSDCIFCKIVAGQLPCCKVYEDADTLAFMDIGPIVPGHTLVIPKLHVDPLTAAPPA
ncbi:MAG: HIT domain-containing protein, partial [Kiritimatiellia bacterium]